MATKRVTLILHGADRELWIGRRARLQVTDVSRMPLQILYDGPLNAGTSVILIDLNLHFDAGQVYGVSVDVPKHRSAWHLINRRTFVVQQGSVERELDAVVLRMMLVPRRADSSDLDLGYQKMRSAGSALVADVSGVSHEVYRSLGKVQQMAVLNLDAKLRETTLHGVPLLSYVEGVRHVAVDRLFLLVHPDLKAVVELSTEFASAPGHGAPDDVPFPLPAHPDSWKHRGFGAGNLQLSFSAATEPLPSKPGQPVFSLDADIDLSKGLGHVFEWLDNHLLHPGKKTDQAQVYTLLFAQNIEPHYTLNPLDEEDDG
jgi:hypothetical protein